MSNCSQCLVLLGGSTPAERCAKCSGRMEAALRALVAKLDLIHDDPSYKSVWAISQMHVGPYTGPTYEAELEAARDVLWPPQPRPTGAKDDER